MNLYYSLPSDIREKIDVTLTKMKHAELQAQLKKQLKRKVYRLFSEKTDNVCADIVRCDDAISSILEMSAEDRAYMYQVGENPDMDEYRLTYEMQSLEWILKEYNVFLNGLGLRDYLY
jgi:hypothetical protein